MKKIFAVIMILLMVAMFAAPAQAGQALADEGASLILSIFFGNTSKEASVHIKLFCTNTSPADTDTAATYASTWCAGTVGEQPKTLTVGSGWTTSGTAPAQTAYAQQDFSFSGDLTTNTTIYGYCLTNAAETTIIGCETLASSFTPHSGYHLYITPTVKLSKGTAS